MLPFRSVSLLFVTVLLSALVLQLLLPWWIVVVVGFAAGLFSAMPAWKTSLAVFAAIGLLWLGAALFLAATESAVLLPRIAALLQLPATWMVFAVTVLIGAVPSSLAAVAGSWLIVR